MRRLVERAAALHATHPDGGQNRITTCSPARKRIAKVTEWKLMTTLGAAGLTLTASAADRQRMDDSVLGLLGRHLLDF